MQVVPVIVKCLPLKEDQEENMTVYKCIAQLYTMGNAQVSIITIHEHLCGVFFCGGMGVLEILRC